MDVVLRKVRVRPQNVAINIMDFATARGRRRGRFPLTKKLRGTSCLLYPHPNHNGSRVTAIIPAPKRTFHFKACLFPAGIRARYFTTHENIVVKSTFASSFLYLLYMETLSLRPDEKVSRRPDLHQWRAAQQTQTFGFVSRKDHR